MTCQYLGVGDSGFPSVDVDTLRTATGAWATGVVVVTASHPDGRDAGLVMVSLAPVSQEPPLVLWSVDRKSGSLDVWLEAPGFALHLLADDQEPLAWQFARKGPRSSTASTSRAGSSAHRSSPGAAATIECVMHAQHDGGDHVILVGRVVAATVTERPPLVMHRGRMHSLPTNSR